MANLELEALLRQLARETGQSPEALLQQMGAVLSDRLGRVEASDQRSRLAALWQLLETVPPQGTEAGEGALSVLEGEGWLWGQPTADPGTLEFGPPLSPAEIAAWEERHGVRLPEILRQAYLQQDGGISRSQQVFLYRLEEIEPVGLEFFAELGAEPPSEYDPNLTFQCGYDDVAGASLFLAYQSATDPAPLFYGYWTDGGSLAWTSDPASVMVQGLP